MRSLKIFLNSDFSTEMDDSSFFHHIKSMDNTEPKRYYLMDNDEPKHYYETV